MWQLKVMDSRTVARTKKKVTNACDCFSFGKFKTVSYFVSCKKWFVLFLSPACHDLTSLRFHRISNWSVNKHICMFASDSDDVSYIQSNGQTNDREKMMVVSSLVNCASPFRLQRRLQSLNAANRNRVRVRIHSEHSQLFVSNIISYSRLSFQSKHHWRNSHQLWVGGVSERRNEKQVKVEFIGKDTYLAWMRLFGSRSLCEPEHWKISLTANDWAYVWFGLPQTIE